MKKEITLGGQAVINGVLMRSKTHYTVSVRKPNNKIKTIKRKINSLSKYKFFTLPFIRGVTTLIEMLVIGTKALNFSAEESLEEKEKPSKKQTKFPIFYLIITLLFSIALALFIFKFIPLSITQFISNKKEIFQNRYLFNLTEGVLKILILIIYITLIGLMKDVKTLFQYHGAEHKAVYCYEKNLPLTTKNVKKFSTLHPRCGTAFLLIVIVTSIIVYIFLPTNINFFLKLTYRILLLPIIAGIAYEIIKLSSKNINNVISKILIAPGLLLQKLTTKEPDNKQIEVAITALKKLVK